MSFLMTPFAIPIVAILAVFGYVAVQTVMSTVRGIVKHRNEIELKQSMIDRGMSAEEIERVIQSTSIRDDD